MALHIVNKTWALICAAIAVCAVILARFIASGNLRCFQPIPPAHGGIGDLDSVLQTVRFHEGCHDPLWAFWLEIGATILAALAVGFWTARRRT